MTVVTKRTRSRSVQISRGAAIYALGIGLALAGCTGLPSWTSSSSTSSSGQHATAEDLLGLGHLVSAGGTGKRDLTQPEKDVISHAVGLSVSNPNSAQYKWPQISDAQDGTINYCGMVNAKSPYPSYSGWQAYIVEASITAGKVTSAVVGLIAGGKDVEIVRKMCKKYDLDPGAAG